MIDYQVEANDLNFQRDKHEIEPKNDINCLSTSKNDIDFDLKPKYNKFNAD